MRALFVGRFQPFHLGHLNAIEYVSKVADYIIIGVGSSQEKNTLENPFSYEERVEMIEKSLKLDKNRYTIQPIPDFGNEKLWVDCIVKNMPKFDVVYTNSPKEKKIFKNCYMQLRSVPLFDRKQYIGTEIRRRISSDNHWQSFVPNGTAAVIRKVNGVSRLKKIVLG